MVIAEYCLCGSSFIGHCRDRENAQVKMVVNMFWAEHQGEGHGPTNRKTCINARRRESARIDREYLAERKRDKSG